MEKYPHYSVRQHRQQHAESYRYIAQFLFVQDSAEQDPAVRGVLSMVIDAFKAEATRLESPDYGVDYAPADSTEMIEWYKTWLKGFVTAGGTPTHFYNYPFGRWEWGFPKGPTIAELFGSRSRNIIVPTGVDFEAPQGGHSNIFYMDGYKHSSGACIPCFLDTPI